VGICNKPTIHLTMKECEGKKQWEKEMKGGEGGDNQGKGDVNGNHHKGEERRKRRKRRSREAKNGREYGKLKQRDEKSNKSNN